MARDVPRLIQALHAREIRGTVWDSVTAVYLQLFALQAATSQENPSWAIEVSPMVPAAHRVLGPFRSSGLGLYVASVHGKGLISTTARDTVARIWDEFVSFFPGGRLPEPDAAPASNQGLMLAFDDGDNHLEFEILPDGPTEVFFLCRQTGETWDTVLPTGPLSFCSALIQKLHLFAGA